MTFASDYYSAITNKLSLSLKITNIIISIGRSCNPNIDQYKYIASSKITV